MNPKPLICVIIFLYGIIIGSFLNVCIYRIPLKEDIVTTPSHCTQCGHRLQWYELFPIFSYLFLRGRCRKCGSKISIQYPIIEGLNGVLYVWVFLIHGLTPESVIYCLCASALIVLSVIDFGTYEIPAGINIFLGIAGIIRVLYDLKNYMDYILGFMCVSGFLFLVYIITRGKGIGGGDIKLMAVSGLILGWKYNILAFVIGCILGSVIHLFRMRISKEDKVLAFGPYLSAGIMIAILYGKPIMDWYIGLYT
ncbi:prepilin peptidase [Anaerocolumna sp.]|uniref:prepilin peptidase n=1 Tax=Anaerocolumna sp. TaxID=2041569 RepID=UPI0028A85C3F|nr:prepilin peptidase [Anaerocolumna sp.]